MKQVLLIIGCCLSMHYIAAAQKQTVFVIQPGYSIADVLSLQDIYHYPQFISGVVHLNDGHSAKGKLNYNFINGEMQFINGHGDTLSLAQEKSIKDITIGANTFYFNKGYLEKIESTPDFTLTKKVYFRDLHKKIGGYGIASASSSINSISSITSNSQTYNLKLNEEITLTKYVDLFFKDKQGTFYLADKKSLLKLSSNKALVENYLKQHSVRFNNEEDLTVLLQYINQLK